MEVGGDFAADFVGVANHVYRGCQAGCGVLDSVLPMLQRFLSGDDVAVKKLGEQLAVAATGSPPPMRPFVATLRKYFPKFEIPTLE